MVTEDYVSFETAKFLKEKGFEQLTYACFSSDGKEDYYGYRARGNDINRPTLQMAMKWLREVHNIAICVSAYYPIDPYELNHRDNKPYWKIRIMNHIFSRDYDLFNTYEEACEAAIKYCLENLI